MAMTLDQIKATPGFRQYNPGTYTNDAGQFFDAQGNEVGNPNGGGAGGGGNFNNDTQRNEWGSGGGGGGVNNDTYTQQVPPLNTPSTELPGYIPTAPTSNTTDNGGGGTGTLDVPTFTPPDYTKPPAFNFNDFKAPSIDEALNDPGYKFRKEQGENSLQNWAAARGTLNDSGTAKALIDYGQGAASQEYQNVYNRDMGQWNANRSNQLQNYNTNYGTQYVDPYNIAFQGASASFAPQMVGFNANVNSQMAGYQNQNGFDMAAFNANNANNALMYQTQSQAGQHTNDMNYLNAWNQFLNSQNYYSNWQDRTYNKVRDNAAS